MTEPFTVSIALASFNGERYIREQIDSLINQSIYPNEIIVVDDCSLDGTCEILDSLIVKYPIIKYYRNIENIGVIETFKIAISKCKSKYVALCDQDDIWEVDKLKKSLETLLLIQKLNRPAIVFSDLKVISSKNAVLHNSFWKLQNFKIHNWNFKDILIGNIVTGCTIVMNDIMKTEVETMPNNAMMHDHWIALVAFGLGNYGIIEEPLVRYRLHSSSVTLKSKFTYFKRFKLLISTILKPKGNYFNSNIKQAELFLNLYSHYLDKAKLEDIKFIIALKQKSPFRRKLIIGSYKYFIRVLSINLQILKKKVLVNKISSVA